jgi:hypothetical protein
MNLLAGHFERSFVIALPQLVGCAALKGLHAGRRLGAWLDTPRAPQDVTYRADAGNRQAFGAQEGADLARPPTKLAAHVENPRFHVCRGAAR